MADDDPAPSSSLPLTPYTAPSFRSCVLPSDDSGYRTAQCSTSQAFVIGDEDDLVDQVNFSDLDMEDEVFDNEEDEEEGPSVERPLSVASSVVCMRNRAFSFPLTLADVRFPLTIPVPEEIRHRAGSGMMVDFERLLRSSSRLTLENGLNGEPSSRSPSVHCWQNRDDVDEVDRSVSPAGRRPNLPDLVLSGERRKLPLAAANVPKDAPSSCDLDTIEYQLACCLARLGDDFESKYFTPTRSVKSDSPDSSASLMTRISFASALRLWRHLMGPRHPAPPLHQRQRSRSTTD
ncbi:uncharacterized protein LOC129595616 [Paramacrobiotus metropolitanus]|uniref:uncharacterized protein LOC129595616 n=1 Tax=Paramacrobiotus metropolitanus TaxID=2943436 RepID=UPI002446477D|nr:uncharacterized protein LOC129595616 [Paramacrobiotus metropolitanus]